MHRIVSSTMFGFVILALIVSQSADRISAAPPQASSRAANPAGDEFAVQVVSSAPGMVTGGDARLHILVPRTVPLHQAEVWVNGVNQRSRFSTMPGTRMLTGVIDGLQVGANTVTVKANGNGKGRPAAVSIALTNYPITGPVFSGPHQYPFVCTTMTQGLGQPIADDLVSWYEGV